MRFVSIKWTIKRVSLGGGWRWVAMYRNMAAIKCRRSRGHKQWVVILTAYNCWYQGWSRWYFLIFCFLMYETKECFALLISRHLSIVPTSHVAALYGKTSQRKQLSQELNLFSVTQLIQQHVSSSQFVHLLFFAWVENHLERAWKTSLSIRCFVCWFNFDFSVMLSADVLQKCALKHSNRSPASDSQSDILLFYLLTPTFCYFVGY